MTTSSSTPSQQTPPDTETRKLATQLSVGPSFREAAGELLRQSLLEKYPDLDIDPAMTLMGTSTWELIDDQIVPGPTHYETLSSILARQAILKVPTLCVEGNHFLTLKPVTDPPLHLPVRIVEVANLINTLALVVYRAFQEQLVTFWNQSNGNGPRWQTLTQSLRRAWNVQHVDAWTDEDCTMARTLFHAPTRSNGPLKPWPSSSSDSHRPLPMSTGLLTTVKSPSKRPSPDNRSRAPLGAIRMSTPSSICLPAKPSGMRISNTRAPTLHSIGFSTHGSKPQQNNSSKRWLTQSPA
ncbi:MULTISPECIES: hypothetical protein [Pseudomonas fluorescens group]|uniref:Uncharacterized protein n=1 Tax=Pseudomonas fluorescens TaxID=294 RepID=A0AAE2PZV4_PSEFL|nr:MULTISPECIES: hypothetical protein [Pseudomonas fluorescens group]MBD8271348.1 hypothetical protein [Pseudomonas fluorescens]UOB24047.1 hypothetical protein MRY17_25740 [Pseudomonas orientalis]